MALLEMAHTTLRFHLVREYAINDVILDYGVQLVGVSPNYWR